jgi:membrane-bound metal-dependent hydrolase YbcI (DUF457 family)
LLAGHFGLAAGVKSVAPSAPLWALMLATQWLDIFFVPLYLAGIETIEPVDPTQPTAYGGVIIHAVYTHSLVGAGVLAVLAGLLAWSRWGRRVGVVIAAVAFSHWLLDLVVHRGDLPILPGNVGNLPELGFGLWRYPVLTAAIELLLVLGGAYLYYRSALSFAPRGVRGVGIYRRRVMSATVVVTVLMLAALITNFFGIG